MYSIIIYYVYVYTLKKSNTPMQVFTICQKTQKWKEC